MGRYLAISSAIVFIFSIIYSLLFYNEIYIHFYLVIIIIPLLIILSINFILLLIYIKRINYTLILLIINILTILFPIILHSIHTELPKYYNNKYFENNIHFYNYKPRIYKSTFNNDFIVIAFQDSKMSFGSGHQIIGVYNKYKILIDENTIGEFPIELDKWNTTDIYFKVYYDVNNTNNNDYINNWINKTKNLSNYCIHYNRIYK